MIPTSLNHLFLIRYHESLRLQIATRFHPFQSPMNHAISSNPTSPFYHSFANKHSKRTILSTKLPVVHLLSLRLRSLSLHLLLPRVLPAVLHKRQINLRRHFKPEAHRHLLQIQLIHIKDILQRMARIRHDVRSERLSPRLMQIEIPRHQFQQLALDIRHFILRKHVLVHHHFRCTQIRQEHRFLSPHTPFSALPTAAKTARRGPRLPCLAPFVPHGECTPWDRLAGRTG